MTRRFINQLRDNEVVSETYQIFDKQLRPNKNGNLYLQFQLQDKSGAISGRIWNVQEDTYRDLNNGDFVLAEGAVQRYQSALQFIGKKLTAVDSGTVDMALFTRTQSVDIPGLKAKLQDHFKTVKNPSLRNLVDCFWLDAAFMERFCAAPAGVKLHHAYPGGLLEHTVQMMDVVTKIAPLYPVLDRDLLLVGAFLHDIGKTEELTYGHIYEMAYVSQGQLPGHPYLGMELLLAKIHESEKLAGEPFDPETAMLLKHLLISHHGTLENGSAKVPMTLEAMVLHFVDSIDSKLAEFLKYMQDDPNADGDWTNYVPAIERKLYKKNR